MKGSIEDPWDEEEMSSFMDEAEKATQSVRRTALVFFIAQIIVALVGFTALFWIILTLLTDFGVL